MVPQMPREVVNLFLGHLKEEMVGQGAVLPGKPEPERVLLISHLSDDYDAPRGTQPPCISNCVNHEKPQSYRFSKANCCL